MKFNLERMPPNLKMSLKVGNVFGARGGCRKDSPRFWVLVSLTETGAVLIGLSESGEVISGTKYAHHTVQKWPVVGFVKDISAQRIKVWKALNDR